MLWVKATNYLVETQGIEKSKVKDVIKKMLIIFATIDHFDEHLHVSQQQFFPPNKKERTLERMLEVFEYIYLILRGAYERYELKKQFDRFWDDCKSYLGKCGYADFDTVFMAKDGLFYSYSFYHWQKEFKNQPEGLATMYDWFRVCFGIIGNEENCRKYDRIGVNYDWHRMKACHETM